MTRDALIERHQHLARVIACQSLPGLPKSIELEDLVSAGYIGLIEAADAFDAERGVQFSTYAVPRIRSRILDYLRSEDRLSRRERERVRMVELAQACVYAGGGSGDEEIAAELGWEIEALYDHEEARAQSYTLSTEVKVCGGTRGGLQEITLGDLLPDDAPSHFELLLTTERKFAVAMAWDRLPEREKTLLDRYYREGQTFREIAPLMGCSEERVWQIHEQALGRIRGMLLPDQALWE
jgi:RNA polymerase sigma factor FliA